MPDSAQPARYDDSLGAWVFSRYTDVAAALSEPRLSVGGEASEGVQVAARDSARQSFSAERIAHWQREMDASARTLLNGLPVDTETDLVREFAQPWALSVAVLVTGARGDQSQHLAGLAHQVFLSAAHSTDGQVSDEARAATADLARALRAGGTDDAIATQAFVAVSQTFPCLLANAWLALFQHPEESARLWNDHELLPNAVEELLRFAGPSRAVFRRAVADVSIHKTRIRAGERVVLLISAANRDPARYSNPHQLDIRRDTAGFLAFGRGPHYCAGAQLMRGALATATRALIEHSAGVEWIGAVTWIDGFAIRGPQTLPVRLGKKSHQGPAHPLTS